MTEMWDGDTHKTPFTKLFLKICKLTMSSEELAKSSLFTAVTRQNHWVCCKSETLYNETQGITYNVRGFEQDQYCSL